MDQTDKVIEAIKELVFQKPPWYEDFKRPSTLLTIVLGIIVLAGYMKSPVNKQIDRIGENENRVNILNNRTVKVERFLWNHYKTEEDRLYLRNPNTWEWTNSRGGETSWIIKPIERPYEKFNCIIKY